MSIAAASLVFVCVAFTARRRRRANIYKNVLSPMPPTIDLIAKSLGTDVRMSDYRDALEDGRAAVMRRSSGWPTGTRANPINVHHDVHVVDFLDENEVRASRKDCWPNAVHNDAANPIQIFDDISQRSGCGSGGDENSVTHGSGKSSSSSASSSDEDNYEEKNPARVV
jgi:hypothetical protein